MRDVALLPTGGDVLIGVLNNDADPAGGILVVQSVSIDPGTTGISVSVLNHETLRITDQGTLAAQVRISYRISNGKQSAEGEVVVVPIPAPEEILQPVTAPDTAYVRAGDVVTIPVLANDTHPSDDALHLAPKLIEPFVDPEDGEAFVSQDTVRFKAGPEAKTVYLTYEAVDSRQQKAAGYVTVQILPVDEETNAAPRPRDLVARTLSGTEIDIAVPLDGIDADGDSVELLDISSSPTKGRILEVAQNYFTYEAFDDSTGVDVFKYLVRDRLGKEGTATVRVGIAPAEQVNQAPYAVKDAVVVRPGREIAVPVMLNDSDPEGDDISLVKNGLEVPAIEGLSARVSGDRVLVQAPNSAVETSLQYTITDARGATATAVLQITVDEDVPLQAPVSRDDRLRPVDLEEGSLSADLDILENDEDPDGTTDRLDVKLGAGATLLENGKVRVTVTDELQLIRYTLTDQDDLQSSAFIFVPSVEGLRPTLTSTKPLEVVSGETKEVPLSKYVTVAGGGEVVITEHAKVSAVNADGSDLVKDETTLVYTSAPGYFGQDALTFEVTDGTGPDDPEGRKATLSIPINVLPPDNQPPEFVGSQINVAPGEPATVVDLAALTNDPDPEDKGKHDYSLVDGEGKGISARIDGDKLLVEASSSAKKGAATTLTLRITDGETEPVEGSVLVQVTASNRAMPAANTDTIAEADQGKAVTVPVLANDFNPFPETPLKLLSANVETGAGSVSVAGDDLVVTPSAEFVGTLVVRYTIQDATEDVDRARDRSGHPHRSGRSRRSGCADGDQRAGSDCGGLVRRPVEQRRRDHEVHREIGSGECVLEGVPVDDLHPGRADEQRRVRVPGDGHEPGGGVGAVGFVGGRSSGRAAGHPEPADAGLRRQVAAGGLDDADDSGLARGAVHAGDLSCAAVGDHPERGHRQLPHVGGLGERRQLPGAGAGAQSRARAVELEQLVVVRSAGRAPAGRVGTDDRRAGARRRPGADAGQLGDAPRERRRDRQLSAGGVGRIHPAEDVDAATRNQQPGGGGADLGGRRTRTGSAVTTRRAGASSARCRRRAAVWSRPPLPRSPASRPVTVS